MSDSARASGQAEPSNSRTISEPTDTTPPELDSTGEDVCPTCGGSGFLDGGARCADCRGTGTVSEPIAADE